MTACARRGFTLTEVLVAIAIVGFGLLSLLTLLPVGLRSTRLAGDYTTAAFLAQQELDEIRARAQVRDYIDANGDGVRQETEPYESGFDPNPGLIPQQRDNDGFGYYDLPFSLEKGTITNILSPNPEFLQSETFIIRIDTTGTGAAEASYFVFNETGHSLGSALVGDQFTAPDGRISFLIRDNENPFPAPNDEFTAYPDPYDNDGDLAFDEDPIDGVDNDLDTLTDEDPPESDRSDVLVLKVHVVNDAWYAYWAAREDFSEDRVIEGSDLTADGLDNDGDGNVDEADENDIDGVLTQLTAAPGSVVEDTGLDMVPNFFDRNFNTTWETSEPVGETGYDPGFTVGNVNDPHGDDGVQVDNDGDLLFDEDPVDGIDNDGDLLFDEDPPDWDPMSGRGTEGNGAADRYPENQIQRVTVTVVWREGGRNRESRFSTYVANRYF